MRIVTYTVIVALLVSLVIVQSVEPSRNLNPTQGNQPQLSPSLTLDSSNSNLTWSARTQQVPQTIENNSIAAGDHVIVNGEGEGIGPLKDHAHFFAQLG